MMYDVYTYIYIKKNIKKIYGAVSGLRSDRFSIHPGIAMFKVLQVPYCSVDVRRGPIFGMWTFCLGGVVHSICISPVSFACLHESGVLFQDVDLLH